MPAAARQGDTGVPHCSPYTIQSGSGDVFVNGRPAARQGDSSTVHLKPAKRCSPHTSTISAASGSVFVNGRGFARVGDRLTDCTSIASGSGDVFVGG
jgi:uncharacterized Zn-binding protein involved in type VI secretion